MKTLRIAAFILLGSITFLCAQSESRPAPPPILTATNGLQRVFGPTAVYDGVLPEVKRRGGILSRSDLNAPVTPGREFRNISVDPHTGQPQGVIFLAVRF
ncbi:MAG TPA: hypothetical protein VJ063_04960 [Verrucomicrobiae bacterium]|nr:hypothetical protein [Verrucomicrobiae bacterium]